jgi:hypothetical protein
MTALVSRHTQAPVRFAAGLSLMIDFGEEPLWKGVRYQFVKQEDINLAVKLMRKSAQKLGQETASLERPSCRMRDSEFRL